MVVELGTALPARPSADAACRPPRSWPYPRGLWLAGMLPFVLLGAVRAGWFSEGDTFWEIRAGMEVLRRRTIFLTDDLSWTVPGRPWHPNSWLFDVLLALSYGAAGPLGLALFTVLSVALFGVAVSAAARALGTRPLPLIVTASLFLLPMVVWISTRPQTVTYALLVLSLLLAGRCLQYRGRRRVLGLAALYLLTAVWTNLHLAALGILPAVAAGLAAQLVVHRRTWRGHLPPAGAVLAVAVLGCASSPLGAGALTSALATRSASSRLIVEWAPLWQTSAIAACTWVAAAVAVVLAGAAWRRRPGDQVLAMFAAGAAILLLLGVTAARFSPMALAAALPAVAAWAGGTEWAPGGQRRRTAFLASRTAFAWLAALLVIAVVRLPDLGLPSPSSYPTAATVDAIPAGCRTLNEYDDGGYIALRRQSDGVRVAMDGRNDVYGSALVAHLQALVLGRPGALAELGRSGVACLLLAPERPLVAQALAAGWRTAARDHNRVLLLAPLPHS